jgi:DNA-binding response OmpR family regulator
MGDRYMCIVAGADDYVAKPVNVDILLDILTRLVQPEGRPVHG